jgi:3-oxoacyl-[acyl-carrier protein] reductase
LATEACESFNGRAALVTGAAGDIGKELCDALLEAGARVFRMDIKSLGKVDEIIGDITDLDFVKNSIEGVYSEAGGIDILANIAGICPRTPLLEISPDEWWKVMDINLTSAFFISQFCARRMIERKRGCILNMSSLAGKVGGIAVGAHYSASKAALICLTKSFARSCAPHGVRVNALAPGIIDTAMTVAAGLEKVDELKKTIPIGRTGSVNEVVKAALFLLSDKASYITGCTLDVNGGLLMD